MKELSDYARHSVWTGVPPEFWKGGTALLPLAHRMRLPSSTQKRGGHKLSQLKLPSYFSRQTLSTS